MFLTSCATNPAAKVAESPKFQDESAADLVVHYSSDRTLYRLKPDAHEGAFYHIFNRQELCEQDAARAGKRDLAVVIIGYYPKPELEAQAKQGWFETLTKLNYRRVVILRMSRSDQVNGLAVLDDRQNPTIVSAVGQPVSGGIPLSQLTAQ